MFKSDKIMYFLLLLAILILMFGSGYSSAASINESNQTANIISNNDIINLEDTSSIYENNEKISNDITRKNFEVNSKNSLKSNNELEPISLSMDDFEASYGELVDIDVVTDPEVDEGVLSFYVDEALVGTRNLSHSAASYSLRTADYLPGSYELLVSYSGSLRYATSQTTANLIINKIETDIANVDLSFNPTNDIDVSLNINGLNDELLDYGTLNVYYQESLIKSIEIEDYDVCFTLDKRYNMEVLVLEYVGDDYYDDCVKEELISIDRSNVNIYLPYLNAYHSDVINQKLTFYTEGLVNDGKVRLYIDGIFVNQTNVSSNDVDVTINTYNYHVGHHLVYIEYVDSDVYEDTFYQTELNIRQINTTLYTNNITTHKNEIITLRATVYNYVDEINEGLIEFVLDDESIKTVAIKNTTINEKYLITDNIAYGTHSLKIYYHGTERYQNSQVEAILNVIKYSNSLSLRNYTLNDDGNIVINIREYSYNNTVDDGEIELYINGILIQTKNVTGNITSITLPEDYEADNNFTMEIKYINSEKFEDANLSIDFNPEKINTTTRINHYINNQNILNVTGYVYATNYADINEGLANFYLNDKLIATVNIDDNRANVLYDMNNMSEQNYTLKVEYEGSRTYRHSENVTTVEYKTNRKTLYITADNSIRTTPGTTIDIFAKITDYEGNLLNITTTSNITILGVTSTETFIEGVLNHQIKISEKQEEITDNITIEIPETRYYKNATRNIKLVIVKNSPYITASNSIRSNKYEKILINATLNLNKEILLENITGIVKINGKTVHQGKFINGELQYKLVLNDNYKNNEYNITIKSIETNKYHSALRNITLLLNSRPTYITSKNIVSKTGEKIIINASIYDMITRKLVKGTSKACIKINDVTLENIYVTNGHLIYSYVNDYSAKEYSIKIIYGENGIYNRSEWNGTLTIKSSPLSIMTDNINTHAYENITIKANIMDGNKLAEGVIKTAIKINNKTILEENITDGIINLNYTLSEEIGSGTHNLTIIAGDTHKYTHNITTVQLIVNKNYKHVESSDITSSAGNTIKIRAQILDMKNSLVTKKTNVNIKIGGNSIANLEIVDGIIEYDYMLPNTMKKGLYEILIQAGENSGYYHATTNNILVVE